MHPAPYKVSRPEGAAKINPIDGAALRKESWILGQCPDTKTTNMQRSFQSPMQNPAQKFKDNEAARVLRQKVAGTSIKDESPAHSPDRSLQYQTNTQIVHRSLGEMETLDKSMRDEQRRKLTRANFIMGKSPQYYGTTAKQAFIPMRGQAHSQEQRKKAMDNNRRTNFISQGDGGFEAPQKKFDFGTVPSKGAADLTQVTSMIDNLRREHFKLGEKDSLKTKTSTTIGSGVTSAKKDGRPAWAHLNTNYELGTDNLSKTTDYQSRFA